MVPERQLQPYFNPRAPRGARPKRFPLILQSTLFQSTRPSRGATLISDSDRDLGDKFQSTRPSRGATVSPSQRMRASRVFQSTRPSRGATPPRIAPSRPFKISIHAPSRGATLSRSKRSGSVSYFNPRPLAGRDSKNAQISLHIFAKKAISSDILAQNAAFQSVLPLADRKKLLILRCEPL